MLASDRDSIKLFAVPLTFGPERSNISQLKLITFISLFVFFPPRYGSSRDGECKFEEGDLKPKNGTTTLGKPVAKKSTILLPLDMHFCCPTLSLFLVSRVVYCCVHFKIPLTAFNLLHLDMCALRAFCLLSLDGDTIAQVCPGGFLLLCGCISVARRVEVRNRHL